MIYATATLDAKTLSAVRTIWRPVVLFRSVGNDLYLEAHGDFLLRARLKDATVTQPVSYSIGTVRLPGSGTLYIHDCGIWINNYRLDALRCEWPDHFTSGDSIRLPLVDIVEPVHWVMSRNDDTLMSVRLAPHGNQLAAYASDRKLLARAVFDLPSPPSVTLPAAIVRALLRLRPAEVALSVDGDRILIDAGDWQLLNLRRIPLYHPAEAVIAACEDTSTAEPTTLKDVLTMIPEPRHPHVTRFLGDGPLVLHHGGKFPRIDTETRTLIIGYKL